MPSYCYTGKLLSFKPVPPGEYAVTVVGYEFKLSSKGNDMIEVKCRLNGHGSMVWDYLVFTENSAWKIDGFLRALGIAPEKGTELEIDGEWFQQNALGRAGWAQVRVEEYGERKKNKIEFWIWDKKPPEPEVQPDDSNGDEIPF